MNFDEDDIEYVDDEVRRVRPYLITKGRTEVSKDSMPVEALVEALATPDVSLSTESRQILDLTKTQYLSIAEISAHVKIPVNVARILVSDLADANKVRVHGLTPTMSTSGSSRDSALTLSVLESVLNGISAL